MHPAVEHIRGRAGLDQAPARSRLESIGVGADTGELVETIGRSARLTVNFHPDRIDRDGRTVAGGLLADGRYRSQHETGISNGGRSAVAGGLRNRWERELFGDAYERSSTPRPIYGALDLTRDPHGGSPRFGSSFLVLEHRCIDRATFCFGDSHVGPTDVGTIDAFDPILAGLFESARYGDGLGRGLSIAALRQALTRGAEHPARDLDHYVEAQIHGGVVLERDVASIVLDPSFRDTDVDADFEGVATRFDVEVRWHDGSELAADDVPADFRGPDMPALALDACRDDGIVDAAAIGRALDAVAFTEPTPDGDPESSPRQQFKKLWHCVLRFGTDSPQSGAATG